MQIALRQLMTILADVKVTDVLVNSHLELWVDSGGELAQIESWFATDEQVAQFAKALILLGGNHLDFANPICDVTLAATQLPELSALGVSRVRVHAVLAAGISPKCSLSIRVHREAFASLADLGAVTQGFLPQLTKLAESNSNFVIAGGAAVGKTTLLRAMLAQLPALRTVVIEDTAELSPLKGHVISLTSRAANSEGAGYIGMSRLLTESLRMRADRLVVGEVRSHEITTLLEALNLGVRQVAFSLHASSPQKVRSRLLALWLAAGRSRIEFEDLLDQISLAVIFMSRVQHQRKIESISWLG